MAISRQTLFVGAAALIFGAGLVYITENKGLPELYGHSPKKKKTINIADYDKFRLLYIKFGATNAGEPTLTVRHASFQGPGSPDDVAGAISVLRANAPQQGKPSPLGGYILNGFDNFKFRSRHMVYIFVDNNNVGFQNGTPISFTPYGANEPVDDGNNGAASPTRDKNFTFYNLEPIEVNIDGENREVISFVNIFKDKYGNIINRPNVDPNPPVTKSRYSMNINLNICKIDINNCDVKDPDQVVPMIIDPDTGNGLGTPPPL